MLEKITYMAIQPKLADPVLCRISGCVISSDDRREQSGPKHIHSTVDPFTTAAIHIN